VLSLRETNSRAINIYTYNNTKRLIESNFPTATVTSASFFAAILAGLATSTATNPIWVVKTRLQLDKSITGERRYKNSLDCLVQIYKHEGLKGFTRGLSASYLGISEGTLQWVSYEQLKRIFRTEKKEARTFREKLGEALGAGFFAKLIATVITYPHEVPVLG
jgi:solute carrier family 25, member 33/36